MGLGDSPATQDANRRWLAVFAKFCSAHSAPEPSHVTPEHLEEYRRHLMWEPNRMGRLNKPNTVFLALRLARVFLRWCVSQKCIQQDPTRGFLLSRPSRSALELLTAADLRAVLATPNRETPRGLRDQLLLILLASKFSLADCRALEVTTPLDLDSHLANHYWAYLRQARPALVTEPICSALFLTQGGKRMTCERMMQILMQAGYQARLTKRLSATVLRKSYREQIETLATKLPFLP